MKFGPVPVAEAVGAVSAHTVQPGGLRKGETVSADHAAALRQAGIAEIVVAALEPGDLGEDAAARRLAAIVAGEGLWIERPFTGRANIFAEAGGVLVLDIAAIDRINAVDERLTLATLPAFRAVEAGEMVGTVKVIPFAVEGAVVDAASAAARGSALRLARYRPCRVAAISTILPSLKASVVAKTLRVLEDRLRPAGSTIATTMEVPHEAGALASAIERLAPSHDLVVVYGASAIADRRDVIPDALERAGGTVEHLGMPVDPGNLLMLGHLGATSVLGAPGCARSPKENGFDWVLQRLLAGLAVSGADIRRLGAGGLLMEIVSRPQPRQGGTRADERLVGGRAGDRDDAA